MTQNEITKRAERAERAEYLNLIMDLDFEKLDIGDFTGATGYLDFIKEEELESNNVMTGLDSKSRKFIVFRAKLVYTSGRITKSFSTFFQRYSDNDLIWMCCGHQGTYLFDTQGSASNVQIKMLYKLLESGCYELDGGLEQIKELGLNYFKFEQIDDIPIKIQIDYFDSNSDYILK